VGSDSGRIVILEANEEKKEFIKIHQETYGKTGCRRIVPGEYLASDPKGRAIMIAAVEKQKFVYILNRDTTNKMTISSPLEAHKSHTIIFDICGLDVGYENPLFAALEVDYGDSENESSAISTGKFMKILTYYEMDLGLNHVVRKNYETVDSSAHMIISVPGSPDGPGGILICCENFVIYKNLNHQDIKTIIPKRKEPSIKGTMIISSFTHKQKEMLFFLIQSEIGDLYKLTLHCTSDIVHGLQIQYFDTIPPSNSICILKNGFLFAASECSNQ
jgi:splicing factor 3B subunit 3